MSVSSIAYKNSVIMCKNNTCSGNILIKTIINVMSLIFWVVVLRSMMVCYWRCRTRHWPCLQGMVFSCMTLEGGTSVLSQNFSYRLPTNASELQGRAKTSGALWWKSEKLQVIGLISYVKSVLSIRMVVLCHHLFFFSLCLHT
jgi:hypothetical protein